MTLSSKEKGDITVGQAIAYYTRNQIEVLLPLGDRKPYDLVIDREGKLLRVQCKYTSHLHKNEISYIVSLRTTGGNQSFHTVKFYEEGDFDLYFISTEAGTMYEIPFDAITNKNSLNLGKRVEKYIVS
jgi:hypothetical protein